MSYVRKTRDEWTIQGNYGYGDGFEDLAAYDTRREAVADLRLYRENEPQYSHRLVCRRVPLAATSTEG